MTALHAAPTPMAPAAAFAQDAGDSPLSDVRQALPAEARAAIAAYLGPRAGDVDSCAAGVRESLAFLNDALADTGDDAVPNRDLPCVSGAIATAAEACMSSAFSLWCHRMVLEYVSWAPADSWLRSELLPDLRRTAVLGSTALAAAMAHHVGGAPLPVEWRADGGELVLEGRINWASNLFPPGFVLVTAAARAGTNGAGEPRIVVIPGDAAGFEIQPYPQLLALQATGSSSIVLRGVRIPAANVVSDDFAAFISGVRPTFLLLQSSFCWGLTQVALGQARSGLRGIGEVFRTDVESLEERARGLGAQLAERVATRGTGTAMRELVRARLEGAQLATAAVALEGKVTGGRGYVRTCDTARRLREAAFLPVQAPTEGQLRWELSRSA